MTAKLAVAAALMPLCFVPVALVAHANQVRLFAFEGVETRIERACSRPDVARQLPRPVAASTTVLARISSPPTEAVSAAVGMDDATGGAASPAARRTANAKTSPSRGCNDWRPLNAGPAALAATVGPVRACEGSPPERPQRVAAQSPRKARNRAAQRPATMSFEFDLRDPH